MTDAVTHIRRLFLEPKDTYSIRDAAAILCCPSRTFSNGWKLVSWKVSIPLTA